MKKLFLITLFVLLAVRGFAQEVKKHRFKDYPKVFFYVGGGVGGNAGKNVIPERFDNYYINSAPGTTTFRNYSSKESTEAAGYDVSFGFIRNIITVNRTSLQAGLEFEALNYEGH